MLLMVPNSDCRMLLSIIGARNIRNGLRSGAGDDTSMAPSTALRSRRGRIAGKKERGLERPLVGRPKRQISVRAVAMGERYGVVADVGRPVHEQTCKATEIV